MQLFLDTTDLALLSELASTGLVDGVTTNPSLIAKSGRPMLSVIADICARVSGPVSAEVTALDAQGMVREGRRLAEVAANVVVKAPLTFEGLKATRTLAEEGHRVNVTLCFTAVQALLAAKSGAAYISPFIGRLDDLGASGMDLIQEIRTVYDNYRMKTKILAASVRNAEHVRACALVGADCATLPPSLFSELVRHPLTDKGLAQFTADWAAAGQSILAV